SAPGERRRSALRDVPFQICLWLLASEGAWPSVRGQCARTSFSGRGVGRCSEWVWVAYLVGWVCFSAPSPLLRPSPLKGEGAGAESGSAGGDRDSTRWVFVDLHPLPNPPPEGEGV